MGAVLGAILGDLASSLSVPGVYRQETFARPAPVLLTGVPGFVGFAQTSRSSPVLLRRFQDRDAGLFMPDGGSLLPATLRGFFDNGGDRCYVACADVTGAAGDAEGALAAALDSLAAVDELDLLALPDAMGLPAAAVLRLQARALAQCAQLANRVALLDALRAATPAEVLAQGRALTAGLGDVVNGALYHPWVRTDDGSLVPPCGLVAGVIARTDAAAGVFKAPANALLSGVVDLASDIDDLAQQPLNDAGINCLRALPGRGIRIWGARTLSRDPAWRYLSVRRLVLTLHRWIEQNLGWAAFEPNTPVLWAQVERVLRRHLTGLWQAGALIGDRVEQAFYVRCNADTSPAQARANGQLVTEIGLCPAAPAEFVVVRVNLRSAVAAQAA